MCSWRVGHSSSLADDGVWVPWPSWLETLNVEHERRIKTGPLFGQPVDGLDERHMIFFQGEKKIEDFLFDFEKIKLSYTGCPKKVSLFVLK